MHTAWRCSPLAHAIQRLTPHSAHLIDLAACLHPDQSCQALCDSADFILLQGTPNTSIHGLIQHWKAQGKTVAIDVGNDCSRYLASGRQIESHPPAAGEEPPGAEQIACQRTLFPPDEFYWGLRLADAVLFASPRLADDWHSETRAYVLPDFIDLDRYLNIAPAPHDGIVIGWRNEAGDLDDLVQSGILEALERLLNRLPYLRVLTWGNHPGLYDRLAINPEQIVDPSLLHSQEWPHPLASVDIGLAPITGYLSERQGWLDILEFMVMKIPWLASESPAYYQLRPYGWLVQNSANAWERVLQDMIEHLRDYQIEADGEAYLFGLSQGVDENAGKMVELFAMIRQQTQNENKPDVDGQGCGV